MTTYNDVRANNARQQGLAGMPQPGLEQAPQGNQPFTADMAIAMRGAQVPTPGQEHPYSQQPQYAPEDVLNQSSQQGLGLPSPEELAGAILQGAVKDSDLAYMPQELVGQAFALVKQFEASQVPRNDPQMHI